MTRSDSITELAAALAQAQAQIAPAKKESENLHFRHRYADLAAVWDACRAALTKHGLAVVQSPRLVASGDSFWLVEVETTLLHASGQSLSDVLAVPVTPTSAQVIGSAITYARRYALAAFVGVAPEDDDGQAASVNRTTGEITPAKKAPKDRMPAALPETTERVTVKVLGVVIREAKDGSVKYIVTGGDQRTYATTSLEHATTAKAAREAGLPVAITFKSTKAGREILELREVTEAPL